MESEYIMIKNNLMNYKESEEFSDNIKKGIEYLINTDFNKVKDGKYVISDDIYVNLQTYVTKTDADFEAHREYSDIQYIICGSEYIGVTEYKNCKTKTPYSKENDIEFLSGEGLYYKMEQGDFMILHPTDAHKPSIMIDKPETVRKAVVKVRF